MGGLGDHGLGELLEGERGVDKKTGETRRKDWRSGQGIKRSQGIERSTQDAIAGTGMSISRPRKPPNFGGFQKLEHPYWNT